MKICKYRFLMRKIRLYRTQRQKIEMIRRIYGESRGWNENRMGARKKRKILEVTADYSIYYITYFSIYKLFWKYYRIWGMTEFRAWGWRWASSVELFEIGFLALTISFFYFLNKSCPRYWHLICHKLGEPLFCGRYYIFINNSESCKIWMQKL